MQGVHWKGGILMHFYWQRRRFSPRLVQFTSGSIIILLLLAMFLCYFRSVHAAGGTAPGWPGVASFWTPSNSTFLGTAQNTTSDVWFTGYNGIIGEVFYPTADTPNTTDLQFLVGDSGHTWVDEEKVATTSQVQLYNNHSLAWTVTNTATSGKYRITKIIYTDPIRNSLIQQVTFTALNGNLSNYLLYALYNPTIHDAGNNNTSSIQIYNGTTMLVTTDSSGNYASALAASFPYVAGMTSSGFVGVNDGWTDLEGSSNCGSSTCPDYTMNDTYSQINVSTTTSVTFNLVLSFDQTGGANTSTTNAEQTLAGTLSDTSNMLGTYVSQWNSFDNSLNAPPAVGSTTAVQQARQQEYYLAANVLKASQDKMYAAFVAGLGTPWGDSNGERMLVAITWSGSGTCMSSPAPLSLLATRRIPNARSSGPLLFNSSRMVISRRTALSMAPLTGRAFRRMSRLFLLSWHGNWE
jgi:glucoamylase